VKSVEEIKAAIEAAVRGAAVAVIPNPSLSAQHSLLIDAQHAVSVAEFLRDDEELALDYLSNATGVELSRQRNRRET
jgi:NADH-quinone oxidoreductase subunit C